MVWAQQRQHSAQEWLDLRLPAEGDDAGANHSFNYVARIIGPSDEQEEEEVSTSLYASRREAR